MESAAEPRLRTQLSYSLDKPYGGSANITSRVLVLMAAEGRHELYGRLCAQVNALVVLSNPGKVVRDEVQRAQDASR